MQDCGGNPTCLYLHMHEEPLRDQLCLQRDGETEVANVQRSSPQLERLPGETGFQAPPRARLLWELDHPQCPGWAEAELFSFAVSVMGLCFGFALSTELVIQRLFCYCWVKAFSAFPTPMQAWEVGRRYSRESWPKVTKGIFHPMWHRAQHIN